VLLCRYHSYVTIPYIGHILLHYVYLLFVLYLACFCRTKKVFKEG
jgi:hypothetical protein